MDVIIRDHVFSNIWKESNIGFCKRFRNNHRPWIIEWLRKEVKFRVSFYSLFERRPLTRSTSIDKIPLIYLTSLKNTYHLFLPFPGGPRTLKLPYKRSRRTCNELTFNQAISKCFLKEHRIFNRVIEIIALIAAQWPFIFDRKLIERWHGGHVRQSCSINC